MNGNDNFDEAFLHGLSGIKRARTRKKILRFSKENGLLSDVEGSRVYVPGQGIVEVTGETEVILDCGHPAGLGIGHVADCGHLVCKQCVQKHILECADPGCFRKLCTVKGCRNSARMMIGVYFCRKHQAFTFIEALSKLFSIGPRGMWLWIDEIKQDYFLNAMLEIRKELPDAGQKFTR